MRIFPHPDLEAYRRVHPALGPSQGDYGYFVYGPCKIISSGSGSDWEHVSVSCVDRCPTWDEMCKIKDLFWSEAETVLQFHPKKSAYVNAHEFCLHLWKRIGEDHALPPKHLIG
jgi:hypothetical protein